MTRGRCRGCPGGASRNAGQLRPDR
jgi:hypothetical protein